jgi:hypothetical protein
MGRAKPQLQDHAESGGEVIPSAKPGCLAMALKEAGWRDPRHCAVECPDHPWEFRGPLPSRQALRQYGDHLERRARTARTRTHSLNVESRRLEAALSGRGSL